MTDLELKVTTMTSIQISELTGKRLNDVHRDIRTMLEALEIDGADLHHEEYQALTDNRGYVTCYHLNKNLTLTLVSGYSVELRYKVAKRLNELEEKQFQERLPTISEKEVTAALAMFPKALKVAETAIDSWDAQLAAFNAVKAATGVDLTELMKIQHIHRDHYDHNIHDFKPFRCNVLERI